MRADLHVHTVYSDGAHTPREVAERAKAAGVALVSFTDHDSMEGMDEKRAAAEEFSLVFVRGWEVSSYDGDVGKVHVLGYNCTLGDEYQTFLRERKRSAIVRAQDVIDKANAYFGLSLTLDDVEREHRIKSAPLHTMHAVRAFARVLNARKGARARKAGEIYAEYFAQGKPAYSDLLRPTPQDAIDVIHACGGIAVLAHPGRIEADFQTRETLMDGLCAGGLDGIECTYTTHTEEETEYFREYARRRGLLETGGSDFHAGDNRRVGYPTFYASDALLKALGV